MTTVTPIKVDQATDRLVSDAAHFLGRTKKDIVGAAVREFVEAHSTEIDAGIEASITRVSEVGGAIAATPEMLPLEARLDARRSQLVRELTELGASNVRVFGSVARGEETADSDIDLLVDVDDDLGLFALAAMRGAAERVLGTKVDIVPSSGLKADLAERVLAEARQL